MPSRACPSLPGSLSLFMRRRASAGSRFVTGSGRRCGAEHEALLGEPDAADSVGQLAACQADAVRPPFGRGLQAHPFPLWLAAEVHDEVGVGERDGDVLVAEAADAVAEVG